MAILTGCPPAPGGFCSADADCGPCERCVDGSCEPDPAQLDAEGRCRNPNFLDYKVVMMGEVKISADNAVRDVEFIEEAGLMVDIIKARASNCASRSTMSTSASVPMSFASISSPSGMRQMIRVALPATWWLVTT
mgnify:CR=1 FL=1